MLSFAYSCDVSKRFFVGGHEGDPGVTGWKEGEESLTFPNRPL
jgi:hypothetical protein